MSRALWKRLRRILSRLTPGGDLAQRTAKSGVWAFAMNVCSRGLTILMWILVARLLTPRAFGIYGIAILAIAAANEFSTIGTREALVQREEDNVTEFLNTVWVMELVRGAVVTGALYLAAPYVATFFNEPLAGDLTRFMAAATLITAARNPAIVYFQKNLQFHKEFVYNVSGAVVQFALALWLASLWGTVWSLGVAYVVGSGVRTFLSYLLHGYRPRLDFQADYARELLGYGKWITGSSMLYILYDRGDDAVVGWLLSSAALGYYQFAYRLSNAPATEISKVVSDVMFPTFSRLQDNPAALRDAFFRALQLTTFVSFPMALGIVAIAPAFVRAVLGTQWLPMIPVLQILAVFGLARSIMTPMTAVWRAIGRPDYGTKLQAIRVLLMAVLIYPVTVRYGMEGTALLVLVIFVLPVLPIAVYLTIDAMNATYRRIVVELVYPLVASGAMLGTVLLVRANLPLESSGLTFALLLVIGVLSYCAAAALLVVALDWGVKQNIEGVVKNVVS